MIQFPNVQTKVPSSESNPDSSSLPLGLLPPQPRTEWANEVGSATFDPNAPVFNISYDIQRAAREAEPEMNRLPKTLKEAASVLDKISADKTSKNRSVFDLDEIKEIAKNLNISPTGNKTEIVRRIRLAVEKYNRV